jgi:AcrR family transcriptional regulator
VRRRLSPEERRHELLAFGRGFFAAYAADACSMEQIAERAGVSKGLLYNYFGGRRGFYVATIEAIAAEVTELTEPDPEGPALDALADALARYLGWVRVNDGAYRVLVQGGLGVDAEVGAIVEGLRRTTVERVLTRLGADATDPAELAAYGWVCFTEHACLDWLGRPGVGEERMVAVLLGALQGALSAAGVREMRDA